MWVSTSTMSAWTSPSFRNPQKSYVNEQYSLTLKSDTLEINGIVRYATLKIPFESSVGELVHLGSMHCCTFT